MRRSYDHDRPLPCPLCGYDLRAHPIETRCPECGGEVSAALAADRLSRGVEDRVLDLWCIGVLEGIGVLGGAIGWVAIRRGQYAAVMIGMASGICLVLGVAFYVVVALLALRESFRPSFRAVRGVRRARLARWLLVDGVLTLLAVGLLAVLVGAW